MLPMDTDLLMQIVNQHRKELEQEAESYRLCRQADIRPSGWVSHLGRCLAAETGHLLTKVGSWMEQAGMASEPPLDAQIGRSA